MNHENPKKSDDSIFFNFHDTGYMKILKIRQFDFPQLSWTRGYMKINKNQMIQFSQKIRHFDFIQFSRKLKRMIFVDFHVLVVMKVDENQSVWFFWIFMYRVMKVKENWSVWFLWIFMYPVIKIEENWNVWFLLVFMYLWSWKWKKIESSDFWEFSCNFLENWIKSKRLIFCENWIIWFLLIFIYPRGHESWRKLNHLIFKDFHVMKIEENWIVWFLRIFMYPGS